MKRLDIPNPRMTRVVVATTAMLSFISFWRAAAIVLNDLGSSAYYVGGIAEQAVGRAAPWFVFGVMLFSYAVRAIYIESCAMFTRGGVYRVVKEAMGGTLAKFSVSALMFDYILTGPISGVSAGQYIVNLIAQTLTYAGHPWSPTKDTINLLAAVFAVLITIYFWWRNTRGLHESSNDALRIMYVTSVMVVVLILWSTFTIVTQPDKQRLPPSPVPANLSFNRDAVGWLPDIMPQALQTLKSEARPATSLAPETSESEPHYGISHNAGVMLGLIGILIAFGHSMLAMSGEESLAQVNREIEYPKHKNLVRAGFVIFVYSLLFTSLVSFFAYALIPDNVRPQYFDNLISGIAMNLAGPVPLRLCFQAFIVIVGFLMLAGAVNTAIIGSNGVLNRLAEDRVMADWFRTPHRKYGTSYRIINLIVLLQLATIIGSRGNVYVLGEAYAFGVIWSFAFKGLAMVVLRFKDRSPREWKVPFNINISGTEIPLGIGLIAALLFSIAGINLITKEVATVSGVAFTLIFFTVFLISERINDRHKMAHADLEKFHLQAEDHVSNETVNVRPGNTLCLVRDYNNLQHLKKALEWTDTTQNDLVVLTVHITKGPHTGYEDIREDRLFTSYEELLFTRVVALVEKAGKHVALVVVPSSNFYEAAVHTAVQLDSAELIAGRSPLLAPAVQAKRLNVAWEELPSKPNHPVRLIIVGSDDSADVFELSGHQPELPAQNLRLVQS